MSLFAPTGGKGAKFPTPGTTITGTIARAPFEQQTTKFGTNEPDYWPNGVPKMQIVVPLENTNVPPEDGNDDGDRTLYVSSNAMKQAIASAIQAAGQTDVAVGGRLTVTYTQDDPASKNPANPKKLYSAEYTAPPSGLAQAAPAAASQGAPATPQAAPVPQPQAAPAPAAGIPQSPAPQAAPAAEHQAGSNNLAGVTDDVATKAQQLLALGALDHTAIAAALGITQEQVATLAGTPI